jgi:glycosyltransferase involved in cell wall biosynthesis
MLSVCILTYNEESSLQKVIDNIKSGVDEIVIIDGFSTDQTSQIAQKNNTVFFQRVLNNDYGSERNFGIEKSKGDWIFMLDADELCSKKLVKNLKYIVSNTPADGITILWKNYCDNNLVEIPRKLALFKRHGFYKDALHEKVHGLSHIVNLKDEEMYLTHYKSKDGQIQRLTKYKVIIQNNLDEATKNNDQVKLGYYKELLRRHLEKEMIWLGNYI